MIKEEDQEPKQPVTQSYLAEHFGLDSSDLPEDAYPLRYRIIEKYQALDKKLISKSKKNKEYKSTVFHGGGKQYKLLTKHGKIVYTCSVTTKSCKLVPPKLMPSRQS